MSVREKQSDPRYRAPALDKGLDILELLATEPSGLTRAEIVRAMDKGPSEIYRMLERLVARDYVVRSPEGDRYALSMKLFLLGTIHPPLRRLRMYAQPLMDDFAEKTLQSVHLAALDRASAVVIAQASGPADWEFRLRIGSQLSLLTTGSGETLLAFQEEEMLHNLINHAKSGGVAISPKQVSEKLAQLAAINKDGFRMSESQQLMGVTDISVPTLDSHGNGFAVLTCPYIKRIDEPKLDKSYASPEATLEALQSLANEISISR